MPGYTHLQRAQPVLLAPPPPRLRRDARTRPRPVRATLARRVDECPLGAAALAGTTLPDRPRTRSPTRSASTADRQQHRRGAATATSRSSSAAAAICSPPISRAAPRSWSSGLGASSASSSCRDAFATGSSIMPQKINPDVAELVRGKTGRVIGNLRRCSRSEGPAARLQPRPAGGQGAGVRRGRHAGARSRPGPHAPGAPVRTDHMRDARRRELLHGDRSRRLPGRSAACRSATRTRWSGGPCGSPSSAGYASRRSRSRASPRCPAVRPRLPRSRLRRGLLAARNVYGGTAPEAVARALTEARALVEIP